MKKLALIISLILTCSLYAQQQEQKFEIINTSINSKYAELGVTYLNDSTVLFASSKKNDKDKDFKKDRRKNNSHLYLELYKGMVAENGDIIQIKRFNNDIKNMFFESDIAFTPDFKTIYFTWNNYYDTQSRKDSAKYKTLYLFKASIDENFKISKITPLPFNSKKYSVRSPEVSKDGKQLFLVSDMPNGYGDFDIYVVDIYSNGSHSWPKNLGPNVNTKEAEFSPSIDQNYNLYFSSYGHEGKGNLDIFKCEFKDGKFQKAKSLPSPINSKFDDFALVVDNTLNSGFFTSNRKYGKGGVDIYAFKVTNTKDRNKKVPNKTEKAETTKTKTLKPLHISNN